MALAKTEQDEQLPLFDVQRVQLRFDISADFVAAQVANNVLILALSTNRLLRFDLDNAQDIDDIDLPKRAADIGVVRRLFLDPSASHLLISTTLGENYYLHTQSRQPKALTGLRGVQVTSVAWAPSQPTASTREILVGAADGSVYETCIDPSNEFYRRPEKYVKAIYNAQDAVVGLYADVLSARPETRRLMLATSHKLLHFLGRVGTVGSGPIYAPIVGEAPVVHDVDCAGTGVSSMLAISPDQLGSPSPSADASSNERTFAWLTEMGVLYGKLITAATGPDALGKQLFREAKILPRVKLSQPKNNKQGRLLNLGILLTQFHLLSLAQGRISAVNRIDESVVYNQQVFESGQTPVAFVADPRKNTYWLIGPRDIFEVVVQEEDRDIWRIFLRQGLYEQAQRYAKTWQQMDAVAFAYGDALIRRSKFNEAALILGKSSKPFEDVVLDFIDRGEHDALRKYLLVKLNAMPKKAVMQRIMLSSWLIELFMAKLNELDDTLSSKVEDSGNDSSQPDTKAGKEQLPVVRKEFQDFVSKYKTDLDRRIVYEIVSSHGREEELLYYASVVGDGDYVVNYWIQREKWQDAMAVLKKQTDPNMFYKYSTTLMSAPGQAVQLVEVLMRQGTNLDAKRLIPALLNYNKLSGGSISIAQNQAIRYLLFCITHAQSTDSAVHNTLVSLYASHPTSDENQLLSYLESQSTNQRHYDTDFALRLCISHKRVQSAVHILTAMQRYPEAVDLALKFNYIDLAATVADRPGTDDVLRKKLWLRVAKAVIQNERGIKAAMEFLNRCELLHIEDLIPFFPDFVVIDDFKDEICTALEDYSRQIDNLKREMDESASTAQHIKEDIRALDRRYAIMEPGEKCWKCRLPLLVRQFFVFPCQHAFHADCLENMVMKLGELRAGAEGAKTKRIRELQRELAKGIGQARKAKIEAELDGLVAGACVLCGDLAVKMVDLPFVSEDDVKWEL
ncbi:hypothetical protein K470DRAFT_260077 [Piedraia hortae CBS 480.64]|uniref:Uncharacterized protein n=1 Tax=Piedraia hortae CBS 480.64 TaxID=1314780 RepID=A0A6A7BS87_9PEZI|nr:hypothetical protein K470DRAFT_260077 [Piedraia hortae CBS 480.64]